MPHLRRSGPGRYAPETRRLRLNGQSTSLRLEAAFWAILDAIAAGEGLSTPAFISKLHDEVLRAARRGAELQLAPALRLPGLPRRRPRSAATKVAAE